MKDVPNDVITTKDLMYFKDILKINLTGSKKAREFKTQVKDAEIKKFINEVRELHNSHFNKIMENLK